MLANPELVLPFAHLNLRFNPFGEPAVQERAGLAVVDWTSFHPGRVLQFIGQCGRGKSTHLLALHDRVPGSVYERVEEDQGRFRTPVGATSLLLLDEAQFLRPRQLRRALREFPSIVLGSHRDLSGFSRRPFHTILLQGLDEEKLDAILRRRIEWARRGPGLVPCIPGESIRNLIRIYGDDIRSIEDHLYEIFQKLEEPCHVQV